MERSSDACGATLEISAFKTASGELVEDEGLGRWDSYTASGLRVNVKGRVAQVRKTLVSAARMCAKGTIAVLGA